MAELSKADQKLTGWKEIAEYLGVSVRTAQNFENERRLPVRRRGGIKTPVYAIAAELEAWQKTTLRDAAAKPNEIAPPTGHPALGNALTEEGGGGAVNDGATLRVTGVEEADRRQWLRYALAGGGAVLGIAGLGLGVSDFISNNRQPPTAYRINGATLIVTGKNGVELWRHTFPTQLSEEWYKAHPGLCQFADIDGAGTVATLIVVNGDENYHPAPSLICFSPRGKLLWSFAPAKTVMDNQGRGFPPPYGINSFEAVRSQRFRTTRIVVSSHHNWSFPDQVAVLDGKTGKVLSEYWHRGHLWHMTVADLDGDGEPEILLGGVNDAPEYKQATLLVFDHRRISGATKNPTGGVYFRGMEPGTEKAVVFFSRTPIGQGEEFNRVRDVKVESGRIRVIVAEGISELSPCMIYEFDFALRPTNATLVGTLFQHYRELQENGKLPIEPPEVIAEGLMKRIKVIRSEHP